MHLIKFKSKRVRCELKVCLIWDQFMLSENLYIVLTIKDGGGKNLNKENKNTKVKFINSQIYFKIYEIAKTANREFMLEWN